MGTTPESNLARRWPESTLKTYSWQTEGDLLISGGGPMATVTVPEEVEGLQGSWGILGAELQGDPIANLQGARSGSELDHTQSSGWCYWVPFPGVRYYCYGDHPSLLERVKRP